MKQSTAVIAASVVGLLIIASLVYSSISNGGATPAGRPDRLDVYLTSRGGGASTAYATLRDMSGNFVSSSGTFNFTIRDSRGNTLFSRLTAVQRSDFRMYNDIANVGRLIGYAWNVSETAVRPGVPDRNGSGVLEVRFIDPTGLFLEGSGPFTIPSLPKITVTELIITRTGSLGPYLTIYSNATGLIAFSGDVVRKNITLFFFNIGDDGKRLVNASDGKAFFSSQTKGFQVLGLESPVTKSRASNIFVPNHTLVTVTLDLMVPNFEYTGLLNLEVSIEPTA